MALGALPKFALTGRLDVVLPALIACTTVQNSSEEKWAEGRRDAVRYILRLGHPVPGYYLWRQRSNLDLI